MADGNGNGRRRPVAPVEWIDQSVPLGDLGDLGDPKYAPFRDYGMSEGKAESKRKRALVDQLREHDGGGKTPEMRGLGVSSGGKDGYSGGYPLNASPSSGAQKSASQAAIGNDPAITTALAFQPVGGASVAAGFVLYVPPIPT